MNIVVAVVVTVVIIVVGAPVLFFWWLSSPAPTPSAEDAGVMRQLRDIAYAMRDQRLRTAVDHGSTLNAIAQATNTRTVPRQQIRTAADPTAGQLALTDAHKTGHSGLALDFVQTSVPVTQNAGLFEQGASSWVGCYRVELPVLAIDTTRWTAVDDTCPTFTPALQHADRVHVSGATAEPLLRPPCYGTTGYCPGG